MSINSMAACTFSTLTSLEVPNCKIKNESNILKNIIKLYNLTPNIVINSFSEVFVCSSLFVFILLLYKAFTALKST